MYVDDLVECIAWTLAHALFHPYYSSWIGLRDIRGFLLS